MNVDMNGNVWRSISDALVQNKCWLCQVGFRKGKVKKTFTIGNLIRFLVESDASLEPPNTALLTCWNEFAKLDRDASRLKAEISNASMEEW
jgi:hypothetical protein